MCIRDSLRIGFNPTRSTSTCYKPKQSCIRHTVIHNTKMNGRKSRFHLISKVSKVTVDLYSESATCLYDAQVWHVLTRDHTVLPATLILIHKWNEPYLPLLPSGRASAQFCIPLSWPEWLVTNRRGLRLHAPSTNRAWRRVTSLIEINALPLSQATTTKVPLPCEIYAAAFLTHSRQKPLFFANLYSTN